MLLTNVDPAGYIRDIKVWMPGLENSQSQFHPKYLEAFRPFGHVQGSDRKPLKGNTLRVLSANQSEGRSWSERFSA